MHLIIRYALCMEKEQLAFNFYCALVPEIRQLQSDLVYPNYFVLSKNIGLARYPENRNQTCSHRGHSGEIIPKFFVLLQILFCQENY